MECTIVMYHYVRNMHETEYPDIKGLLIKNFIGQLDYLMRTYKIISLEEYVGFLYKKQTIPTKSCVLTFDDGFKDHYSNVYPILKKKKIPACFFPQTIQLTDGKVPSVHKAHFLLAKIGAKKFVEEYNKTLEKYFPKLLNRFYVTCKTHGKKWNPFDDILVCNLKQSIAEMSLKEKTIILNVIFGKYFKDETRFCKELYMNWIEMREMLKNGMSFGSHTINHPSLNKLNRDEQEYEIQESMRVIEKNLKTKMWVFSYPYGAYNDDTLSILKKLGYTAGVLSVTGVNKGLVNPFKIKRKDTINLPFE